MILIWDSLRSHIKSYENLETFKSYKNRDSVTFNFGVCKH